MTGVADVLGELSDEDVEWIVCAGERREVTRRSSLIVEGELPSALLMVLEGELSVLLASGREIRRLCVGDVTGEVSIADGARVRYRAGRLARGRVRDSQGLVGGEARS